MQRPFMPMVVKEANTPDDRRLEYRLPLNKIKELALQIKSKYKLPNIYLGGSQSPKSEHYPAMTSDIDLFSYFDTCEQNENYARTVGKDVMELLVFVPRAGLAGQETFMGRKVQLSISFMDLKPERLGMYDDQVLLNGEDRMVREAPAPKTVFKRTGKLEINPLLLQAFGITPEELGDVIKSAEEPEAMRDMFAFLSDYATLSESRTRLTISGDKLDFMVADLKRRMGHVFEFYRKQATEYKEFDPKTARQLLKVADKARQLYFAQIQSRKDKIAFIDAVIHFGHTTGPILPVAFGISDYGREDYWPRKLLAFLRSQPGMVREGFAPNNSPKLSGLNLNISKLSGLNLKINWNLNVRDGRIVYMPPEEYMERVNIFNRIGMSRVIEGQRKAAEKGYRGIGYYPPLSEQSYRSILDGIRAGNEIDIPNLVYRNGMVENQEGFHRALVARDIGIEKIPVHVIGEMPSVFSRALNLNWNQNLTEQVKAINALKGTVIGGVSMISEAITPAPEPADKEFRANPDLINKQAARAAHAGTSFEPEKRGEQAIKEFADEVQSVYERLKPHARTDAEKALLISEMKRLQASYAQKYNDLLYSHSRIYSTMIAGPSGFPTERMRKINEAYDKKAQETYEWKDRAEKAMLRALKGLATEEAGGEVAVLKNKIAQAEKLQEMMVEANKIIRKKAEPGIGGISKHQQLINMGFTERQATEVMTPDYMGRKGFPAFALTNNSANIRRMKERLIELEKREVTPTGEITFTGGYISDNREEDRVQIFFDQKPPQAMIDKLKGEGWRWAPSVGAWSRKRTDMALNSARRITGATAPAPHPPIIPQVPVAPPVPALQPQAYTPRKFAELTYEMQREIRQLYEKGASESELARRYKLSIFGVKSAIHGKAVPQVALPVPLPQPQVFVPAKEEPKIDDDVHARIQKVIDIIKIYRDKGATYEDLVAGLKGYYLEQSGYVMGSNLNIQKLTDDLKKSGYHNLRELWRTIIVQAPVVPQVPAPQPYAVPELRWVFGTREGKWYLVGPEDRDYVHGITQARMKTIGPEAAKSEYLSPSLARAAAPVQPAVMYVPTKHPLLLYPVRRIAFAHLPGRIEPQPLVQPQEPWQMTQEEYWRAGAEGRAYEGRGTSDYNHKQAVYNAIIAGKPVPANVLKDYPDLIRREVPAPSPKIQSIQDVKQQVIQSIQDAKSMDELKQILKGLGFLPLPEPEKRQLIDLYQVRLSELTGELKFGERIPAEEKKKRRAPQKVPYAPPSRRLEEFGIKEAMRWGYGYA